MSSNQTTVKFQLPTCCFFFIRSPWIAGFDSTQSVLSSRFSLCRQSLSLMALTFLIVFLLSLASPQALAVTSPASAAYKSHSMTSLPGHILPALTKATLAKTGKEKSGNEPITLTLVLKRDDQAGFDHYLQNLYDPKSPNYHHFLKNSVIADQFGPSSAAYEDVLDYLQKNGFTIVKGSANRMTLTVTGRRDQVEQSFGIHIRDYQIGSQSFYANDADPVLPSYLATKVAGVSGLSNLAQPSPVIAKQIEKTWIGTVCVFEAIGTITQNNWTNASNAWQALVSGTTAPQELPTDWKTINKACLSKHYSSSFFNRDTSVDPPPPAWQGADGNGQTIGLVQLDTFQIDDVKDYLALIGMPAAKINDVTEVHVNGGANPGHNEHEVLLDIAAVLTAAPGAKIVVYDAPFIGAGTFQAIFNQMIDDGLVTIISNSWAYCEDQTTAADVQSLDLILQAAAAQGISVFTGSGDNGSTCLDGSPNTAHVPASSPFITAVGATSITAGPGVTYADEFWWNGSTHMPPTGAGGFGVSRFFARPAYQNGINGGPMRSLPDLVVDGDPANGIVICQASAGGCPTQQLYGGTSSSAPTMAGFAALLNQTQGSNLGFLNPVIYPLAGTDAFHDAASMASDFAHVGLGSPDLARLHQRLTNQTVGPVDPAVSRLIVSTPAGFSFPNTPGVPVLNPADGTSEALIVVRLADAMGNIVSGHNVSLAANGGNAQITPASGVSSQANGAVVFKVTNLTAEALTFTATDDTANIELSETVTVDFQVPSATAASISAFPTTVAANGTSSTTVTVTLKDVLGRPTPGKVVNLSQGNGHSTVASPIPNVTDAAGQIQFTATNLVNETVTYTAVDMSDGDLAIPGSAAVTFNNGSTTACGSGTPPVGQTGYVVTPFATGFTAAPLFFGNINFGNCLGVSTPAFLADKVFATDWTGDVISLLQTGGSVSNANRLANVGQTLNSPTVGKDGKLYFTRVATTGDFNTGAVVEINPSTGAVLRTVASGLKCPFSLVTDPLSGDLFFDDFCFGAGAEDPAIRRIRNPASANPTVEVYATLADTPNGKMSFAPDGDLFVVTNYDNSPANPNNIPPVVKISGTNVPGTPSVTTLTGINSFFWVNVGEVNTDGSAKSLIVLTTQGLELVEIASPATRTLLATDLGGGEIGPDGCLYSPIENVIYKLTDSTGGCGFLPGAGAPSLSLTPEPLPSPIQGEEQTLSATLHNVSAPAGTPILFVVTGANAQPKLIRADTNGKATFAYTAIQAGEDTIEASTTVNSKLLTSNRIRLTWGNGLHSTSLSLNLSPSGGTVGQVVTLKATLVDESVTPSAPIAGRNITFLLDDVIVCSATTDTNGAATCNMTPQQAGDGNLRAEFSATGNLLGSTASLGFTTMTPPAPDDDEAPVLTLPGNVTAEATGPGGAPVNFTVTADDNLDPDPTVNCTPVSGSLFAIGITQVHCTATDASGNPSTPGVFNVTVQDTTPPSIVCPANVTTGVGQPVNLGAPTASDLVDASPTVGNDAPAGFPAGTTTVIWTATDDHANSGTCQQTVALTNFQFSGFFPPVDNLPVVNQVKAGQSIPVKFSLGGNQGLDIFALGYPVSQKIACTSGAMDDIEQTVTAGSSSLSYDPGTDRYNYVWKSSKVWSNTCRQLIIRFTDGTEGKANFRFK